MCARAADWMETVPGRTSAPGELGTGRRDVRLYLLDGFRVEVDGVPVGLASSGQRLLAFLALRSQATRSEAAGTLWSTGTESQAQGCLRTTLWRLRKLPERMLVDERSLLRLRPDVRVDARELMALGDRLHSVRREPRDEDLDVHAAAGADLLPGWYDDWAVIGRERVRQRVMHALEALSRHLVARHRLVDAVEVARAAVAAEPLRESAQRVLVEALLALGNRAEAAQAFLEFQAILARELGVEPSPELRLLVSSHLRTAVRWQPAFTPDAALATLR